MKREKYVYNPVTLRYEAVELPLKTKLLRGLSITCAVVVTGFIFYFAIDKMVLSPQERILQNRLSEMSYHMDHLASDFNTLSTEINELQEKDANVHRIIFGMDPIDESLWEGGIGGSKRFDFLTRNADAGKMLKQYLIKAEKLKNQVNLQKRSLDTLEALARERENRLASVPSIKPIREDQLKRNLRSLSGYGIRIHPVHGVKKLHKGIDFTAPEGTSVIASGNGKVIRVEEKKVGYGRNVIIDHGFGYESLYAHMSEVEVQLGDIVIKGQEIGKVGSTGTSTAPHLHYEVRLHNKAINPLDYCLDGLSPSEYQELVEKASIENQSFD